MLINSLLSHASDTRWEEFIAELDRLNVRKAVVVSLACIIAIGYLGDQISAPHVFAHD
jgi:hypothetical protein